MQLILMDAQTLEDRRRGITVGQSNGDITRSKTKPFQSASQEPKKVQLGVHGGISNHVCIPLQELSQSTTLWSFAAEERPDTKPSQRHGSLPDSIGRQPRHSRGQFWPKGVIVVPARSPEGEQFRHDAITTFGGVEREVLKSWPVNFLESMVLDTIRQRSSIH